METNTDTKPSLLKQAMGAVVGSAVALALYYSYEFAAPRITAYVTLPPAERQHDLGDARVADQDATSEQLKRIQSRNQEVAKQMEGADPADYKLENNTWNTDWPTSQPAKIQNIPVSPAPTTEQINSVPPSTNDDWEEFARQAAPIVPVTTTAPAATTALHASAPALPDSGFGAVAAAVAAFGATASRFMPLVKRKSRNV